MAAILVTGATGKQGGSLINNLLSRDAPFQILAVTRNTQSPAAQKLSKKSSHIKLVQGDLDHPADIFKNAQSLTSAPIWGVFSVQAGMGNEASEEPQGKNLIDEAIKHGVKHFVYTSVDRGGSKSLENPTPIPHFIHKHHIEHHLIEKTRDGRMDWTILRPTAFYENLTPNFFGKAFATCYKMTLKGKPLQFVGVSDIGAVAAEVFLNAKTYKGRGISLAGDELTYDQFAAIFKEKTGQHLPTTWTLLGRVLLSMMKDLGSMFKWFHDEGYRADVEEVRKIHPGLKDFGTWLETESEFKKQ